MATNSHQKPPPISPLFVFLFSVFILHTRAGKSADQLKDVEKTALLNFIASVNHSTSLRWNWSEPACSWKGVTCGPSNSTVLYLRLPGKSLVGEIPLNTIGRLTSLRVLSLRLNGLFGPIPSDFSNLHSLTRLMLNDNNFTGQLPYISAPHLTALNVSNNQLNGSIPHSFASFPQSAFGINVYLCGPPSPNTCKYPSPYFNTQLDTTLTPKQKLEILGVSIGLVLVFLLLVRFVGKKMYQHMTKPLWEMERKKLLLFNEEGVDFDDLLKTTAEVLGEGSVGTSYKQVLVGKDRTVVLKILRGVVVTEEEFRVKMEGLGKMKNKNVVSLRGFYNYSKDEKLLVYDYMPAGSLSARLHGSIGSVQTQLDWDHRMRIALSVAKGLAYLHVVGEVVHGNIKSSNIFLQLETNTEASLSDYGLNTLFCWSSSMNHNITGYWAPEVLMTQIFTFESDVYSFGVFLVELLTGKAPNQASLGKEGIHFSKWVGSLVCEESNAEFFDVGLMKDHNVDKMVQLLRIAKDCVLIKPNERPPMQIVVSMMEDMIFRQTSNNYYSQGYDERPSMKSCDSSRTITRHTVNPYDVM